MSDWLRIFFKWKSFRFRAGHIFLHEQVNLKQPKTLWLSRPGRVWERWRPIWNCKTWIIFADRILDLTQVVSLKIQNFLSTFFQMTANLRCVKKLNKRKWRESQPKFTCASVFSLKKLRYDLFFSIFFCLQKYILIKCRHCGGENLTENSDIINKMFFSFLLRQCCRSA